MAVFFVNSGQERVWGKKNHACGHFIYLISWCEIIFTSWTRWILNGVRLLRYEVHLRTKCHLRSMSPSWSLPHRMLPPRCQPPTKVSKELHSHTSVTSATSQWFTKKWFYINPFLPFVLSVTDQIRLWRLQFAVQVQSNSVRGGPPFTVPQTVWGICHLHASRNRCFADEECFWSTCLGKEMLNGGFRGQMPRQDTLSARNIRDAAVMMANSTHRQIKIFCCTLGTVILDPRRAFPACVFVYWQKYEMQQCLIICLSIWWEICWLWNRKLSTNTRKKRRLSW